jgi:hypothetical protein
MASSIVKPATGGTARAPKSLLLHPGIISTRNNSHIEADIQAVVNARLCRRFGLSIEVAAIIGELAGLAVRP